MPIIREYQSQVNPDFRQPQSDFNYVPRITGREVIPSSRPATAADFGGFTSAALGEAATDLQRTAYTLEESFGRAEVSHAHADFAKMNYDLTKSFINESTNATPGDYNFANQWNQKVTDYVDQYASKMQTRAGREFASVWGARLQNEFSQRALAVQQHLAKEQALIDATNVRENNSNAIALDPSLYDHVLQSDKEAILNGVGNYGSLSIPEREKLYKENEQHYQIAAASSASRTNPAAFLNSVTNENAIPLIENSTAPKTRYSPINTGNLPKEHAETFSQISSNNKLTSIATSGIMGNMVQESGGDPKAIGDGGASYGLFQWNGPRKQELISWSKRNGLDYTQKSTQLGFLQYDLDTNFPGLVNKLNNVSSVSQAAELFSKIYERPGDPQMSKRVAYAEKVYASLGDGKGIQYAQQGTSDIPLSSTLIANPGYLKPNTNIPGWDTMPVNVKMHLIDQAQSQLRGDRAEARYQEQLQKQAIHEQQDANMNQAFDLYVDKKLTPNMIKTMNIDWREKMRLFSMVESQSSDDGPGVTQKSNETFRTLLPMIHAPYGDPSKITDPNALIPYVSRGELNTSTFRMLRQEIEQDRSETGTSWNTDLMRFMNSIKASIYVSSDYMHEKDPRGDMNFKEIYDRIQQEAADLRAQNKDPRVLITKGTPQSWYNEDRLGPYKARKSIDVLKEKMGGGGQIQKRPGESDESFRKRTQGTGPIPQSFLGQDTKEAF